MNRFETGYSEKKGMFDETQIWVDRETGVQYLWHKSGYGGGITPLLDKDGKPVIAMRASKDTK